MPTPDPNQLLATIRHAVVKINEADQSEGIDPTPCYELADTVATLDQHIAGGGQMPAEWVAAGAWDTIRNALTDAVNYRTESLSDDPSEDDEDDAGDREIAERYLALADWLRPWL